MTRFSEIIETIFDPELVFMVGLFFGHVSFFGLLLTIREAITNFDGFIQYLMYAYNQIGAIVSILCVIVGLFFTYAAMCFLLILIVVALSILKNK